MSINKLHCALPSNYSIRMAGSSLEMRILRLQSSLRINTQLRYLCASSSCQYSESKGTKWPFETTRKRCQSKWHCRHQGEKTQKTHKQRRHRPKSIDERPGTVQHPKACLEVLEYKIFESSIPKKTLNRRQSQRPIKIYNNR